MMPTKADDKMEDNKKDEYMLLRHELDKRLENQSNITTFLITSVITLLGIGFAMKNTSPYFFLLPFMILLPIAGREYKNGKHISYMVSYMIVFLENSPKMSIKWESNTYLLGKQAGQEIDRTFTNRITGFLSTFEFTILGGVSYSLFIIYYLKENFQFGLTAANIPGICCAAVFLMLLIYILVLTKKYNEYSTSKEYYIKKWLDFGRSQKLISEEEYTASMEKFLK